MVAIFPCAFNTVIVTLSWKTTKGTSEFDYSNKTHPDILKSKRPDVVWYKIHAAVKPSIFL